MKHLIILIAVLGLLLSLNLTAQIPYKISYQGLLTTSNGTPMQDGSYDLKFDVYNLPDGGDLRYTETQNDVLVKNGAFSVILRPPSGIFAESLFVEVTVLDGPGISSPITFSPRSELTSASYAFRADTAEYAKSSPSGSLPSGSSGQTLRNDGVTWVANSLLYNDGTNIGVGTTTPIEKLSVNGNIKVDGNIKFIGALMPSSNPGVAGQVLKSNGSGLAPSWMTPTNGTVTNINTGPGLTGGPITTIGTIAIANGGVDNSMLLNSSININAGTGLTGGGSVQLGGSTILALNSPVAAVNGGTGQISYTTGDLLYASSSTTLSKLSAAPSGNALISGGLSTPPSWDKISLTTHVSGTLPINNGGTNNTYLGPAGSIAYSNGTSYNFNSSGTTNQILKSGGSGQPQWGAVNLSNATEVSGVLPISNGGTGSPFQNFVDLSSTQSIGGFKTFQNDVTIGTGSTPIKKVYSTTSLLDFPLTNAGTNSDLTIALTNASLGDVVILGVPIGSVMANSCYTAWVSSAGNVTVRFNNYSGAAQNPPSGTFRVTVMQF